MLAACNSESPKVCTALFALVPITVVDGGGTPLTGMTITDSILRTHERFVVPQSEGLYPPGTYHVMTDAFLGRFRESGDPVRVTGTNGSFAFAADFVFGAPDGCHVAKLSGPDTVVAVHIDPLARKS